MRLRSAALMALSAAVFAAYFSQPPSTTSLPSPAPASGETGAAAPSDEGLLTADSAAAGERWQLARAERTARGKRRKPNAEEDADKSKIGTKLAAKTYDRPTRAEGKSSPPKDVVTAPEDEPAPAWTDEEIATAKATCEAILKRIDAVAIPQPPLREGQCGAPAPVQLVSIGKSPQVAISPPSVMTCELAEALDTWVKADIQPLAKKHLGAEIVRIETMSSYACRNAYGRVGNKLSEHGKANALDIRGFVASSAMTAHVLEDWGVTQREIDAEIAAAKAAAEKAELERLAAEKAAQENLKDKKGGPADEPPAAAGSKGGQPAGGIARGTVVDGVPKVSVTMPGAKKGVEASDDDESHLDAPDSKKGNAVAPKSKTAEVEKTSSSKTAKIEAAKSLVTKTAAVKVTVGLPIKPPDPGVKGEFLRAIHASACRVFGTTLGPEANAAHRNHFHVDMAPRKRTKICD